MRRTALAAAVAAAAAATFLLVTPGGARRWVAWITDPSPPASREQAAQAQAIVVLGGNRDRVHEGARLHALTALPILLTGRGTGDWPYEAESEKMAAMLRAEHGMEPRWVETRSANTHENAQESWCLLKPQGISRIVLVTDARHMRRAHYEFRWAGFTVVDSPLAQPSVATPWSATDFVPGRAGWQAVSRALEEYRDFAFALLEDTVTEPRCGTGAAAGQSVPNRSRV